MSRVHLIPAKATDAPDVTKKKIEALWHAANFDEIFEAHDLTAVKLHVGERGTKTRLRAEMVAPMVHCVKQTGAEPFLTDTAVLYKSQRDNAVSHALLAEEHGFTIAACGAPFLSADGLCGADEIELPYDGKHYKEIAIATGIIQARSLLVVTHATGHLGTGYGGALKNLGMGCSSRKAKLRQHHGHQPSINPDKCTACAVCAEFCPSDAIVVQASAQRAQRAKSKGRIGELSRKHRDSDVDGALDTDESDPIDSSTARTSEPMNEAATIDGEKCIGCGECIAMCRDDAVSFGWGIMGQELAERIVEHAGAIVQKKKDRIAYITVAQLITKDCDCLGRDQPPLVEDIGFLASRDPVAIDRAVLDLFEERAGKTLESLSYPSRDARIQLRYADDMGVGENAVELLEVDAESEARNERSRTRETGKKGEVSF